MKEQIKLDIQQTVKIIDTSALKFVDIRDYAHLVGEDNIWNKAIQTALEEKKNVYIPDLGKEILINESIYMDSNTNLKVDEQQVIRLVPGVATYMLRNRNILPGHHTQIGLTNPDENITVTGGIWKCPDNPKTTLNWCFCVTSAFAFSNAKYVNITNIRFWEVKPYSLMLSNIENFYVDNIRFDNCGNDGYHVDGPAKYGIARNMSGKSLGDDMIAILAWNWFNCGMANGMIEKIWVENVEGDNNEFRLLTGRRRYPDGTEHDCDIKDCVFENISGFYTYKLYYQPHYKNVIYKNPRHDCAETVGRMDNIYFDGINIDRIKTSGYEAAGIPVYGLFDILADCENLNVENVRVGVSLKELDAQKVKFVNVGPISATFKYTDDPANWGDYFDPDRCCTVDDITLRNITFRDEKITEAEKLVKETHQTINPDYPNTLPAGGTGFGTVKKVDVR